MRKLFLLAFLLCFYGCVLPVHYDMSMKPSTGVAGKYATYEDENGIKFTWSWEQFQVTTGYAPILSIENHSKYTVQIIWKDSALVENGRPYPIYDTQTVDPEDVLSAFKDVVIPPNSSTSFVIARSDNVYDTLNVAIARPIMAGTSSAIKKVGEQFEIHIIADVNEKRRDYMFTFTVEDVN